jgi:hypothetical protein
MRRKPMLAAAATFSAVLLSACGGGSSSSSAGGDDLATRTAAATQTANNNALCNAIRPFYWEIGDVSGRLASASVGTQSNGEPWRASDTMRIASASKWLYAAYAAQRQATLDPVSDVPFLNFTSGYSNMDDLVDCFSPNTLAECHNGTRNAAEAAGGVFHYNADHFQTHAINNGLGNLDAAGLGAEIRRVIGPELDLEYTAPQLAGGARTNATSYAAFLRKLLGPSPALRLGSQLGSHAVCTQDGNGCTASDPSVLPTRWHYSLGHWVEDDPAVMPASNYAYSSGGAFGFYPWVNLARDLYGVVSREDISLGGEGYSSGQCGAVIRQAWLTGQAQ